MMKMKNWIYGVMMLAVMMVVGCEKEGNLNRPFKEDLNTFTVATYALPSVQAVEISSLPIDLCKVENYELIAGQYIDAGDVKIGNDGEYLYVSIYCKDGFEATEENVKIWFGTSVAEFDGKRPVSGKFPHKFTVESGLSFNAKFLLADLFENYNCETPEQVYAVIHVDAVVDLGGDVGTNNQETAYAGNFGEILSGSAWWYNVTYIPGCCGVTEEPKIDCKTTSETAFGGSTGFNIMESGAWWYVFNVANDLVQPIWAGQHILIGTTTYDPVDGTLTISLNDNAQLTEDNEAVKIGAYDVLPLSRQEGGQMKTYKGRDLIVKVPVANFYVIHLDTYVTQCK